jgi:hypothetical protein
VIVTYALKGILEVNKGWLLPVGFGLLDRLWKWRWRCWRSWRGGIELTSKDGSIYIDSAKVLKFIINGGQTIRGSVEPPSL